MALGHWISAATAAGDNRSSEVAQNCAPAISADQSTIYIAVSDGCDGYLLGLDAATLAQKYKIRAHDPNDGNLPCLLDRLLRIADGGP